MIYSGGQSGASNGFHDLVANHRNFERMVRQEVKRSERYCSFVSLVKISLEGLGDRLARKFPANSAQSDAFVSQLSYLVKSTVRCTDIVSSLDRDKILLLLVETPGDGVAAFARRLSESLSDYLRKTGEFTSSVDFKIDFGTFPEAGDSSFDQILSSVAS